MKARHKGKTACLLVACLTFMAATNMGCGSKRKFKSSTNLALIQQIKCVALFPLVNESKDDKAADALERMLFNSMLKTGRFITIGSTEVMHAIDNSPIVFDATKDPGSDLAKLREIGRFLRVEGILSGKIIEYGYQNPKISGEAEPRVVYELKLFHMPLGIVAWTTETIRESRNVGGRNRDPLSRISILAIEDSVASLAAATGDRKPIEAGKRCGVWSHSEPTITP